MQFIRTLKPIKSLAVATLLLVSAATWAVAPPFEFAAFGSAKRMIHTGDTRGQVKLADIPQSAGYWGLGALANRQGEVLLHDGRLLVSHGIDPQGHVAPPQAGDEAALLAVARVRQWAEVALPSDMGQRQFEAFVLAQARSLDLDLAAPFPYVVQGRYPQLTWHVVNGPRPASGGPVLDSHANPPADLHAGQRVFVQPGSSGRLVGVYSGEQFEGVVSHAGERFHVHYADDALTVSGHVDAYAVARGSLLQLPLR